MSSTSKAEFDEIDSKGLRCMLNGGMVAVVVTLIAFLVLIALIAVPYMRHRPTDNTNIQMFWLFSVAIIVFMLVAFYRLTITYTANADEVCRKTMIGRRCLPLSSIREINLGDSSEMGARNYVEVEWITLDADSQVLRITSQYENYELFRDYILHKLPKVRVTDVRRPDE